MSEHTLEYDEVCDPHRYFRMNPCTRVEVILCKDNENDTRIYILEQKYPKGFRVVEFEREVITPLIDIPHDIKDWHYEHDTSRLIL
jgi:hypothetical protein